MYKVDTQSKQVTYIGQSTFAELGFKERNDLQEWIASNPSILGEELLIIQKEFARFTDTKEQLDLLALDKNGNIVVIENKLDDSGRDVIWQASKYASYCANLTIEEIKRIYQDYLDKYEVGSKAEDLLAKFYDDIDMDKLEINRFFVKNMVDLQKTLSPYVNEIKKKDM